MKTSIVVPVYNRMRQFHWNMKTLLPQLDVRNVGREWGVPQ